MRRSGRSRKPRPGTNHRSIDRLAPKDLGSADQLNWIVGVNPFNVSMMDGVGREAPMYLEYPDTPPTGSWRWLRSAGGMVNGITGMADDGSGLQWDPGAALTGPNTDWRWLEQWLPHATWFLYAASIGSA